MSEFALTGIKASLIRRVAAVAIKFRYGISHSCSLGICCLFASTWSLHLMVGSQRAQRAPLGRSQDFISHRADFALERKGERVV